MEEITVKHDLVAAFCIAVIVHGIVATADLSAVKPVIHLKEDTRKFLHLSFVSVVSPPEKKMTERPVVAAPHEPAAIKKRNIREEVTAIEKKPVEKKAVVREDTTSTVRDTERPSVDGAFAAPELVTPSVVSAAPRYDENSPPPYPGIARRRGYEGVVMLSVEVHSDGTVGTITVKASSGHSILDRAAVDAVKRWKFRPGVRWGVPIATMVDVPVRFILKENGS